MHESLSLWEPVVHSDYFRNSSFALVFTKTDVFGKIVAAKQHLISRYFPDYQGKPTDIPAGKEFIATKFKEHWQDNGLLSVHFVNATDTEETKRVLKKYRDARVPKMVVIINNLVVLGDDVVRKR